MICPKCVCHFPSGYLSTYWQWRVFIERPCNPKECNLWKQLILPSYLQVPNCKAFQICSRESEHIEEWSKLGVIVSGFGGINYLKSMKILL